MFTPIYYKKCQTFLRIFDIFVIIWMTLYLKGSVFLAILNEFYFSFKIRLAKLLHFKAKSDLLTKSMMNVIIFIIGKWGFLNCMSFYERDAVIITGLG